MSRALRAGVFVVASLGPAGALSVERAALTVGAVQGEGWRAEGVSLQLDLRGEGGALRVERLALPDPVGEIRELAVSCARLAIDDAGFDCPQARFTLRSGRLDGQRFAGAFRYGRADGSLAFRVADLPIGGTRVAMAAESAGGRWTFKLDAPALTLNSADGRFATDKLGLRLSGSAQPVAGGWRFSLALTAPQGQAYLEPVFLDFTQAPLNLRTTGRWQAQPARVVLEQFHFDHARTLRAEGGLSMALTEPRRLESLQLNLQQALLPRAYTGYLQPFLIGTALDDLETSGGVSGQVGWVRGAPQSLRLKLEQVHMDDRQRRFALYGVDGTVHWDADAARRSLTNLRWAGGSAWRIDLGAAELNLVTAGRDILLPAPTRVPVLDGYVDLRRLELAAVGTPDMRVAFDARLAPVSMERVCRALDWPVFGGTLAGAIPAVTYQQGNLTVGGTLSANVFDGAVSVDKLRLEQPFGRLPKLSADMTLRGIDLEAATSAFSFGRIEGRLDGDVKNLRLLRWQPVAFDGRLYTTPGDQSRHRISQRAIENISDLGGAGAAGVLSRGFLRFFDDFAYDRIALGCRLREGVCEMSGLEPHRSGGYYIVKGRLVPRIDVIGFAPRVSWDALVGQLKEIRRSEGPVIK